MDNFLEYFKKDKFAAHCGIGLTECHPGFAKAEVRITPHHLNGAGVLHGGLLFTLADFAFAAAVNSYGIVTLSVVAQITYFDKSTEGLIVAEAREVSRSNKLIHCDIEIRHESGDLLASFKGTAYRTSQKINF